MGQTVKLARDDTGPLKILLPSSFRFEYTRV